MIHHDRTVKRTRGRRRGEQEKDKTGEREKMRSGEREIRRTGEQEWQLQSGFILLLFFPRSISSLRFAFLHSSPILNMNVNNTVTRQRLKGEGI